MLRSGLPFLAALMISPSGGAGADDFASTVRPFLTRYCERCHGADEQSAERRFDTLSVELRDTNDLADWQDIVDQLNLAQMPPSDEPQPTDVERRAVVQYLQQEIVRFHRERSGATGEPVLRRLNSREYRNTVRDLFHLNMQMFDPTAEFPRDQSIEHLDNEGATLITSGYLLERYLQAANAVVEKAAYPLERPNERTWKFAGNFKQQPEIDQVHGKTNKFSHITLYDVIGADKHEGAYAPIHEFSRGVPFDGVYEIRFKAVGLNREHPYDVDFVGTDRDEPIRLGIRPGHRDAGPLHKPQPMEPLIADVSLADEPAEYRVQVWLDAGFTPRFTYRNGLMDARNMWGRLVKRYPDQFPRKAKGIVQQRFDAIKYGKLPQIHVDDIQIRGPIIESWPTPSQLSVFGPAAADILSSQRMTARQMEDQLDRFLPRAYRRRVTDDEKVRILKVIERRKQQGRTDLEAWCDGIKTALCSPGFIFLEQPSDGGPAASVIASRLSYFLWSSMPDDELLVRAGVLTSKSEPVAWTSQSVRQVVERMLADPKSESFVDGFLGSWLTLRSLGSQPPDRDQFSKYYHYDLGAAMREETRLFTHHLLDEDLPIGRFLDSDFTFVNRRLAEHYGIPKPEGQEFQRVALKDRRRGGLLGQASILTVSANGIDTSPVVRGVWLLDNLLGTPPLPPPPDIEPLDPDVRGAKTIRDQLEKHRSVASCNDCHRKIDPMGFALENFDPIGGWRDRYNRNQAVDASGELPNGAKYQDVISFKRLLLDRKQLFARALATKLLAYGTGRRMLVTDRVMIDRLTAELSENGDGFRTLVKLVASSEAFLGTVDE